MEKAWNFVSESQLAPCLWVKARTGQAEAGYSLQKASEDDALGKADVIIMAAGVDEDVVYSKTTSLQVNSNWLSVD